MFTSAASISSVFWEGGAKTFFIRASETYTQLIIHDKFMLKVKDSTSLLQWAMVKYY